MPRSTPQRDCTPVELPSPTHRGPLKRSNSAASIHSLPTPPPTRKRKRSHSRHSRATDSDSEDEDRLLESDEEETRVVKKPVGMHGALRLGNKRRKMLQVDKIAAELSSQAKEDAFWGVASTDKVDIFAKAKAKAPVVDTDEETDTKADASAKKKAKAKADKAEGSRQRSESPDLSPSSTPPSRLLNRTGTGLLSPPQSKRRSPRKKAVLAIPPPIFEAPTSPAPTRASERLRKKQQPERDSPNNPFLDSPASGSVASEPRTPVRPSRAKRVEKPTITYVFRGVRVEFENPMFDHRFPETGVAPPDPNAPPNLPIDHDDYEADEACPPQVLFPEAHAKARRRRKLEAEVSTSKTARGKQPRKKAEKSEWDTTDEEDNVPELPPMPLPRTPPRRGARVPPLITDVKAAEARAGPSQPRGRAKPESKGEGPATRSKTTLQPPEKDRSDPTKRALGAHTRTKPASRA